MMMAMKTKHPDTDNPTVILYELLSVSVSEKEKKYDKQSKHLIQINWKVIWMISSLAAFQAITYIFQNILRI